MALETYEYSKSQMRKRRFRDAVTALPGILLIAWFAGLYLDNPLAKQIADILSAHWSWAIMAGLMIAVIGASIKANRQEGNR